VKGQCISILPENTGFLSSIGENPVSSGRMGMYIQYPIIKENQLRMKRRYVLLLSVIVFSSNAYATLLSVSLGHGALLYDATQAAGPDSAKTNAPGQWITTIQDFNAGAIASSQITRLYPYSGDIQMTCSNPSACVYSGPGQNVFVNYNTPAFGQASVAAYRAAFPNALILAIIDADTSSLPLLSYIDVGVGIANALTEQICADPNVDGVFFDLEPFNFDQNQGQFALYKQTSINFSSAACIDPAHPHGRTFAIFMSPNQVNNWSQLPGMLGNNGYLVVSAYDVNDQTPPTPTPYKLYTSSVTGKIQAFMDPNSQQYKIPYSVAIPAASSFSEFEQFGQYDSTAPNDFLVTTNYIPQGFTQANYVHTAAAIVSSNAKSGYFLGMDYWSWGQYKSPAPSKNQLLLPNIPPTDVVALLQNLPVGR